MGGDVDTRDINAVCEEARRVYHTMYADASREFVPWARDWFRAVFGGRYGDYQPLDVPYHDQEHTMQGLLCLVRLLHGRSRVEAEPAIPQRVFELGIIAVLLHDSGYLRHAHDTEGTGAKYTLTHVDRSRQFVGSFMPGQGYAPADIRAVQNMIQCTAMTAVPADIPFADAAERTLGYALATADLMGQMAADDYVDRLPQLYAEFRESYEYYGEEAERLYFESPESLLANTPNFWRFYVKPKLENQCAAMYRYLNEPYPDGENEYLNRIEANIDKAARVARTGVAS